MSLKCVHQGCGKQFTADNDGPCVYHPGPPVFHEGQKGWKCCKPRVLTFEEFLSIPPCTTGKHSTTDLPPKVEKKEGPATASNTTSNTTDQPALPRTPISVPLHPRSGGGSKTATPTPTQTPPVPNPADDSDDPSIDIPEGRICRRRGCGVAFEKGPRNDDEHCVYHPGAPIFHEGSKGYSCCKRRVLEFDQFMKIEGCQTKKRHLFVGSGKQAKGTSAGGGGASSAEDSNGEELLDNVRFDFYQSATSLTVSFFLKKINKEQARVVFSDHSVDLDLPTTDTPVKRYRKQVPLYAAIDPAQSRFSVLGTKLELVLAKAEVSSWPVLRSDDRPTGEILQVGRAGKVVR